MSLNLTDLTLLIELVDTEVNTLGMSKDDENLSQRVRDDDADRWSLMVRLAGNLQDEYESQWREGSNFPSYEELEKRMEQRAD